MHLRVIARVGANAGGRYRCQERLGPATLNCQALAALRAASVDHLAATSGLHADTKAMGALAAGYGRLVSAFHVGLTWVKTDRAA